MIKESPLQFLLTLKLLQETSGQIYKQIFIKKK